MSGDMEDMLVGLDVRHSSCDSLPQQNTHTHVHATTDMSHRHISHVPITFLS